ncbi:MAG: serine/threonine protein kinase [Planctomycetota bacterium]|nr:MAG: serine/threonine protein kinase [Planctomycetota bacterium]REJ89783.1 MAG: serine/threonine protein kinase [Planctomycetota bacterium]REK21577.1 MAG: serine/threonine protein kinase [Planctomycetota bacterium]
MRDTMPAIDHTRSYSSQFALCSAMLLLTGLARAEDWPQFRGPNASGVASESTSPPVEFSYEHNVKWSKELGPGVACPVIADGRTFITELSDEETFTVYGLDAASGEELWSTSFPAGELPAITSPNEHASSTPATDGERVFVHFSTIGLIALDAETGSLLWKYPLPMPFYLMGWGAANSPIVYEDMVIFNLDDDLAPYILAIDKESGELRWRTERPQMLGGYAVPVLCTANGRTDVVVAGSGQMIGYDPHSGEQLWHCDSLLRTIMTTPVVQDDRIYMSVQSYGDTARVLKFALLQWVDTDQDGKLDKSELDPAFHEKFDKGDADGDGYLVDEEIDDAFQAPTNRVGGGNIIQCIRGGGSGDVTETHMVWNLDHKAPSNISSPLAYDGRLFLVKKGGISAAFNLEDGSEVWDRKRINNLGNYYASPVAAGDKIYVAGENGYIVVLEAGPSVEVLSKNDVVDSVVATPAIADNRLYVRTYHSLYCFEDLDQ